MKKCNWLLIILIILRSNNSDLATFKLDSKLNNLYPPINILKYINNMKLLE